MRDRLWGALAMVTLALLTGLATNHARGLPLNPVRPFEPEWAVPPLTLSLVKPYFGRFPFFDAREFAEYERGHIPGALGVPVSRLPYPDPPWKDMPRDLVLIVYCDGPACRASNKLASALVEAGFKEVYVFPGGFPVWQAAGLPVHQGPEPGSVPR